MMQLRYLICLSLICAATLHNALNAQVIFSETFDEPNTSTTGIDNTGGVPWTSTCASCVAGDYWYVNGGVFEGNDTNGEATWETSSIDISSCSAIDISVDISEVGDLEACGTGCNSVDWIRLQYNIDGSGWQDPINSFFCAGGCAGLNVIWADDIVGGSMTYTTGCLAGGSTLQVRIGVQNWAAAEFWQIDNVTVSCATIPLLVVTDPAPACTPDSVDLTNPGVTAGSDPGILTYWLDNGATNPVVTPSDITVAGWYYIQLDAGGCTSFDSVEVIINPAEDPSFTMSPTCGGGVATVTGDPGGTFSFNTPPVDAAVIDPFTGMVTGGTFGNTYEILYTTNGPCPTSMIQMVTALTVDDPSFTLTPTCDGATATITGDPGGTFAFNTPPSDAAVIDPFTGTISGGTPGEIYEVIYTTPGPCPNSLALTVVADSDDASFLLIGTCDGAIATVLGTPGGTFTFNVPPGDAAVIDSITGEVTGGTTGSSYDIMYMTSGPCGTSTVVSVTVPTPDDPSFTLTPTCFGATATVTGTPGGIFAFNTQPTGNATIDPQTGTIAGAAGTTYDVIYITNGNCADSLVLSVATIAPEDASFAMTPSCEGGTATVTGDPGGAFAFNIAPLDGAVIDPVSGIVTNAIQNTMYSISYTTAGPCPQTMIIQLMTQDCSAPLVIPSAITPNNDNSNDTWVIQSLDLLYPNSIVSIFNRWGNEIFRHESNPSAPYNTNAWDGTYQGKNLPVGSYYYIIDFNDKSIDPANGTVTIIFK